MPPSTMCPEALHLVVVTVNLRLLAASRFHNPNSQVPALGRLAADIKSGSPLLK